MLKIQITAKLYDKIIVLKSGCLIKHKWLKLEKNYWQNHNQIVQVRGQMYSL